MDWIFNVVFQMDLICAWVENQDGKMNQEKEHASIALCHTK